MSTAAKAGWRALGVASLLWSTACHGLLDVSNPTLVQDSDIATNAGANARRVDVSASMNQNFGMIVKGTALFTDELHADRKVLTVAQKPSDLVLLDRRDSQTYEQRYSFAGSNADPYLGTLDKTVVKADIAIPAIHAYASDSLKGDYLAQVFAVKAFIVLQMAETICSGFPINEVRDNLPVFNPPYTTDSATKYAIALTDSALAYVHDSTRFADFARVIRGRALLDLGQYSAAAAAVNAVTGDFVYQTEGVNSAYLQPSSFCGSAFCERYVQSNAEGGTGLPFVAAHDARTPMAYVGVSLLHPPDSVFKSTKYTSATAPITLASGIEARLIEAEAALNANDPSWFATLNALRESIGLSDIATMPSTTATQVDLLYSERAFWLYFTGRRLGDLRRLMRNYGRGAETVFPTGTYPVSGAYSTGTSIPFIFVAEAPQNPYLTSGCTVR